MPPAPLPRAPIGLEAPARRLTRALDTVMHRLYGWRWNPLHQSGALAAWLLVVLTVTGIVLLLFYRVGAPADSVQRMAADPWLGRWVRSLHRYATTAALVAATLHALRLLGQARAWGPRTRAWVTGVLLVGVGLLCAWTGFVMAWDSFGLRLALGGARLLDALPILSEPLSRDFLGAAPPPPAFFFINLFLHIALPLAMGVLLWLHVSRVARPVLAPPRTLRWRLTGVLVVLSLLVPAPIGEPARPLLRPDRAPIDLVTAWWLPLVERVSPLLSWGLGIAAVTAALAVPWMVRRPREGSWAASVVDPRLCTGCDQCPQDCPWGAITMIARSDDRPTRVASVDPERCVSCGICAASCAPMGIGPPGRSGRDQLAGIESPLLDLVVAAPDRRIVVLSCAQASPSGRRRLEAAGARVELTPCVGTVHTSVIERLLRQGSSGVILAGCPPRDCAGREGPVWLEARVHHQREAELQARVDRRRVRIATLAVGQEQEMVEALRDFAGSVEALGMAPRAPTAESEPACESAAHPSGG